MKTKKMTLRYWNALSEGSQRRALLHVFPLQKVLIEMCATPTDKATMEYIFPELKESEDGRIKKELIRILKGETSYTSKEDADKYIAWLEKQGKALDSDKVIEWLEENVIIERFDENIKSITPCSELIRKFKKDFGL